MTREQWLLKAVDHFRSGLFRDHGAEIPEVRVSVGFPGKNARKVVGVYYKTTACLDGIPQIYISPVHRDPVAALDTLVHELVHACRPDAGHGKDFRKLALAVGLQGPMRSASAGPELKERLNTLAQELGEFPHAGINLADRKKQTTRLNKAECRECGYTVRVTAKWLESIGAPLCPCNGEAMEVKQ